MPSHPRSAWTRLGELLRRRRIELDLRYRNRRTFETERAPGLYRIINAIEVGERDNYEPGTIAALEAAYDIAPGAIGRALDGGDLEVQPVIADAAGAADALAVTKAPPPLAAVPALPESLEPGPEDIFPDTDAETRRLVDTELPALHALWRTARIKGPDVSGAAIFTDTPHEAERWNRLVETGYMEKPGKGYSPAELFFLMGMGRVYDAQYRAAAGQPDRRRNALIRVR